MPLLLLLTPPLPPTAADSPLVAMSPPLTTCITTPQPGMERSGADNRPPAAPPPLPPLPQPAIGARRRAIAGSITALVARFTGACPTRTLGTFRDEAPCRSQMPLASGGWFLRAHRNPDYHRVPICLSALASLGRSGFSNPCRLSCGGGHVMRAVEVGTGRFQRARGYVDANDATCPATRGLLAWVAGPR